MTGLMAAIFTAGCVIGIAASSATATINVSETRAEAAAIAKMQRTHPGESWSVTVVQFHVTWIFAGEAGISLDEGFVDGSLKIFFGMDLFFMLSGFLIGSILLRSPRACPPCSTPRSPGAMWHGCESCGKAPSC